MTPLHSSKPLMATQWQTLAAEKIAEMDALIKRTQATKAWLVEALQSECKGVDDCVTLTFNETGNEMDIILSHKNLDLSALSTNQQKKATQKVIMRFR